MSEKTKKAAELFSSGLNCAQAVLAAFCVDYGLEKETAVRVACGLGSGVRSAEVCGAVSGAALVVGLKYGDNTESCNMKTEQFLKDFKAANRDITCRNLLACDITTPDGRAKAVHENLFATRCLDLVVSAVQILEASGY